MPVRPTKESGLTAVACTDCRKQHLKCDAKRPSCSRCLQNGLLCQYIPSRRGGPRRSRRKPDSAHPSATPRQSIPSIPADEIQPAFPNAIPDLSMQTDPQVLTPTNTSFSRRITSDGFPDPSNDGTPWLGMLPPSGYIPGDFSNKSTAENDDRLRRLYYENFHAAHPILVPSRLYGDQNYPPCLQMVVCFIGSHYTSSGRTNEYKTRVIHELGAHPERSTTAVQAWLLYAIVLNARTEAEEAQAALTQAIDLALQLGMNRSGFASSSHAECSVEAESMRRTWWELCITEIHISIALKTLNFRCSSLSPEVALPCEETLYNVGNDIPTPSAMLDFRRRILAADDPIFSSFSYRLDAAMILCRVIVLNRIPDCHGDQIQAAENALVSWVNHLPAKKLDIVDAYGNVDEMMFQAHLTIGYASMLLHLPRSDLQPVLERPEKSQFWPGAACQLLSTSTRLVHSIKAIEASRQVSDSISVCPNILKHSPFIIPALSLCGMIQLATTSVHSDECFDHHCNRVNLILGCLKSARRTWELAESTYQSLRSSAADLMSASIERCQWNAAPLNQLMPSELASADPSRPGSSAMDGQDLMVTDLPPMFFDRTCFNASFFTAVPDLNLL
ncbi:fungal-specific transcription factor domain-containing protein [Aspergillus granulosus]|uniref:Fungal-specific transcription factor domain-containing protein n=1 Tax=Aspergillus granulosus TaxID=176169 RepID=A0ABR4H548_9EURO